MKAVMWKAPGVIEFTDVKPQLPLPTEALIRVAYCGLCGSDIEEFRHGPIVAQPGVVLGHEISGIVERAAADGSGPPAGTRVVVDVVTGCGRCRFCLHANEGLCDNLIVIGQHVDGGLAEFVKARADRLLTVPEGVALDHAALTEPLAVVVRAVRKVAHKPQGFAAVIGAGSIGLLAIQVLIHKGYGPVVAIEPDKERRKLAEQYGAIAVWHDNEEQAAEEVVNAGTGQSPDVVLECSGNPGMISSAISLVRKGGDVVLLGVTRETSSLDSLDVVLGEKTIVGSAAHMWDTDCREALDLLHNKSVDVRDLISGCFPLDKADMAFTEMTRPGPGPIKILVSPHVDHVQTETEE